MAEDETVRLDNIAHGAAMELFDIELEKVMDNIADPNTEADKGRLITLKFKILPTTLRSSASVVVEATSKLAPVRPAGTMVFFGRKNGRRCAGEHDPSQMAMFDQKKNGNVVSIETAKDGEK